MPISPVPEAVSFQHLPNQGTDELLFATLQNDITKLIQKSLCYSPDRGASRFCGVYHFLYDGRRVEEGPEPIPQGTIDVSKRANRVVVVRAHGACPFVLKLPLQVLLSGLVELIEKASVELTEFRQRGEQHVFQLVDLLRQALAQVLLHNITIFRA